MSALVVIYLILPKQSLTVWNFKILLIRFKDIAVSGHLFMFSFGRCCLYKMEVNEYYIGFLMVNRFCSEL